MFIKQYGEGKHTVVGLHGWGGDHRTFEPLELWRPNFIRMISIDLPGYGASPAPLEWSLDQIAEEIRIVLEKERIEKFTLLGNCSGAVAGLYLTQLIPNNIQRFILLDPFAYVPWYFKIFLFKGFGRKAYDATFATPIGRAITNGALRHRRTDDSNLTASFENTNHDSVYKYLEMMDRVGDIRRFSEFKMPITLVYGEKTFAAVKKSIEQWKLVWPHADAVQLTGAGHLPIEEAPRQLASIVFALNGENR